MARIPLGELEEASRNPGAYRHKLDHPVEKRMGETYINALRQTIFRFHDTNDYQEAHSYLVNRLANSRLRSAIQKAATIDQFEWYVEDYTTRAWPLFQTQLRLRIPLSRGPADLVCSGEIARLDVVPAGGYAGWLFSSTFNPDWPAELRMPLIQGALAENVLGVPVDEVQVGIYGFKAHRTDLHQFSSTEIQHARTSLDNLLAAMAF